MVCFLWFTYNVSAAIMCMFLTLCHRVIVHTLIIFSFSVVAALSKKNKCLPRCFPPFIPIMRYLSGISNAHLSYVIVYIISPSRLGSSLKSFLEFTDCGDNEILFHLVLSTFFACSAISLLNCCCLKIFMLILFFTFTYCMFSEYYFKYLNFTCVTFIHNLTTLLQLVGYIFLNCWSIPRGQWAAGL